MDEGKRSFVQEKTEKKEKDGLRKTGLRVSRKKEEQRLTLRKKYDKIILVTCSEKGLRAFFSFKQEAGGTD